MSDNQWVCHLCFPESKEIGLVAPNIALMLHKGEYCLCWGQGHNGDQIPYCKEVPTVDPDPECIREDLNEYEDKWIDRAEAAFENLKMAPDEGHSFVLSCEEGGYKFESPHRLLVHWLYNRCGELIDATKGNGIATCEINSLTVITPTTG
jgi:hypothetical protein